MTEQMFRMRLRAMYEMRGGFMELEMGTVLKESVKMFEEYAEKMAKSTAR